MSELDGDGPRYAMWNPAFLHRTWNKRRVAVGLPEKKHLMARPHTEGPQHTKEYVQRTTRQCIRQMSPEELDALLAEMEAADK